MSTIARSVVPFHRQPANMVAMAAFVLVVIIVGFAALRPARAASASLSVSPSSVPALVNTNFTVEVRVNSGTDTINAVQADLTFPKDKMQFVSIDSTGSAFDIEAASAGDNAAGTVTMARGVGNAQTVSGDKLVAKVTFKALAMGSAVISFRDTSQVIQVPGYANILTVKNNGTANINQPDPTQGYSGQYWNVAAFSTPATPSFPTGTPTLSRNDPTIDFNWAAAGPGGSVTADHYVARWTATHQFTAGTYRFTATSDDGVRVYVDNQPVIDKWFRQGATTYTGDVTLAAGAHNIKVEYYEEVGEAVAKFSYVKTSNTNPIPLRSDINKDGKVDIFDLSTVIADFGQVAQ